MCLILFAYKSHPKYQLIVGANRDEFYQRPTAPASFWEDDPQILAGRDLEKMGTWMGVDRTGRFAALTNYRDPGENTAGKRTRGELVADFLKGNTDTRSYMQKTAVNSHGYPGYNLLAGDQKELLYFSNKDSNVQKIEPGVHGVSNHLLNTPWPKVELGKAGLAEIIKQQEKPFLVEPLFQLLENTDPAPYDLLPSTGVSREWEVLLSPRFIKSEGYGTRSSTVILMAEDHILFKERVFIGTDRFNQEFIIDL